MGAVFRQERGIVQQAVAQLACQLFYHPNIWQTLSAKLGSPAGDIRETLPPETGILLCTRKNHELVEYALAGMSNQLFVSRYQVQLPGKEEMAAFLHKAVEELGGGDE